MRNVRRTDLILVLLIVITVGVMGRIAIPLPLSEKAKEAQRLATCQSNMRQCATAYLMYINDWDGVLPSSVLSAARPGYAPRQDEVVKFLTGSGTWPLSVGARPMSWAEHLYPSMQYRDIVHCPSDLPRARLSYWWKYAVDAAWRDKTISARREGYFGSPGSQVLIYEHAGWHSGDSAGIKDGVKINVAYMDGHVTAVTLRNGPTAYPSLADERSGLAAIRPGAPMFYNYDLNSNQRTSGVANWIDPTKYADSY
jgi:prepilin-type processing-associated H-X9-DG protein